MKLVVNLIGGPCCGKSTISAELFSRLKKMGIKCEICPEYIKDKIYEHRGSWITTATLFGLALIGFILMGILWTDQSMGWKMGWTLFFFPIIISSIVEAIRTRYFTKFAYPVAVTAAYVILGFLGMYFGFEGWGFYWFLFITIPAYYLIFGPIDNYTKRNRK